MPCIEQIHYITHFTIENNLDTEVSYAEVFICKRLTTRENLHTSNKDK